MCRPRMLSHVIDFPCIALSSTHTALQLPRSHCFRAAEIFHFRQFVSTQTSEIP